MNASGKQERYPSIYKPGDKVRCNKDVNFLDGSKHKKGQVYEIKPNCHHYYNVMAVVDEELYTKVE